MAASVVVFPAELEFRSTEPVQRLEMCNLHVYPVQFVSKYPLAENVQFACVSGAVCQ